MTKKNISIESEDLELFHKVIDAQYNSLKEHRASLMTRIEIVEFDVLIGAREKDEFYISGLKEQLGLVRKKISVSRKVLDQIEAIWEKEQ